MWRQTAAAITRGTPAGRCTPVGVGRSSRVVFAAGDVHGAGRRRRGRWGGHGRAPHPLYM